VGIKVGSLRKINLELGWKEPVMLRLYVDSANREAVEPLLATGIFAGVTTNPTLLEAIGPSDFDAIYAWATAAGAQEIFFQAWGGNANALVDCGLKLREVGPNVIVKVPATKPGVTAAAQLTRLGHPVLLTAVYNAAQGLVAAAAGARYVAPYLGRMGDAGRDGVGDVVAMQRALTAVGSATEILVASVRSVTSVVELAQDGVGCFALAPPVAEELFADPLTQEATEVFEAAAQQAVNPPT
jgi:TalC/MipB family fructose-6-phosphate aldolase